MAGSNTVALGAVAQRNEGLDALDNVEMGRAVAIKALSQIAAIARAGEVYASSLDASGRVNDGPLLSVDLAGIAEVFRALHDLAQSADNDADVYLEMAEDWLRQFRGAAGGVAA